METDGRRQALRRHWEERIPFNVLCGFRVTRWDADGVTMEARYEERLGNSQGTLHGGVLATLVDTAANGAVAAGDDYVEGSSMATVDLSMQYLAAVRDRVVVHASCARRGRQLTFVDVTAVGPDGDLVARGLVTVRVAHRRS
ncbi:MAG TPA: PaaI family thioesterase [Acidimicrobiia bacterium]|nr:PaaI family thioesterase [Acidimicrobiia bacterium]